MEKEAGSFATTSINIFLHAQTEMFLRFTNDIALSLYLIASISN